MIAAWLNCAAGVSGDMLLGGLLDAGAPLEEIRATVRLVVPTGWALEGEKVTRGGVRATRAVVTADDDVPARRARDIAEMIGRAGLPARVEDVALRTVGALAAAEAAVHGDDPEAVHLHEAGGLDAVVDVVGTAAGLDLLEIEEVHASPVATGAGTTPTRHGPVPVPGPAVVELLRGAPLRLVESADEMVTPTGAALLRGMGARFDRPEIVVDRQGFGAGSRDAPDRANVLQILLGRRQGAAEELVVLEANLDDATPEVLAHTVERALAAGAADAWLAPVVMKKGRPGVVLHVLAPPDAVHALEQLMVRETGTLGVRRHPVDRRALGRDWVEVAVGGCTVRVKRGLSGGSAVTLAAEYEDAKAAALALGRPLRDVMAEAVERARAFPISGTGT